MTCFLTCLNRSVKSLILKPHTKGDHKSNGRLVEKLEYTVEAKVLAISYSLGGIRFRITLIGKMEKHIFFLSKK